MSKWENNEEIEIFREYLRIPSVHPNVNYDACVTFLKKQAESLGLPVTVCHPGNEKCPVVVMTWKGTDPNLSAIMLNSHMDVVPVHEDRWTHPPFGAEIDESGNIFARGSQDDKSSGMQYLAAIRILKREGVQPKRTIHVTFVPEEEIGGDFGMKAFVKSDTFKSLNVGFALDESCACPLNSTMVFYAERTHCSLELICEGQGGHGSILHENSPGEKVLFMLQKFMEFRRSEGEKLKNNPKLNLGDVSTLNLTMLKGGLQENVVPSEMSLTFDIRLAIDVDHDAFVEQIKQWGIEAGGGVTIKFIQKDLKVPATSIDNSNPFWVAFESAMKELDVTMQKWVCPGGTDARYIRELNIPAIGFMPLQNTPIKLHDNDEFINADVFLNGIKMYKKIIFNLGNA